MTVEKLYRLEDIVKPILEKSEEARNDDFYLYSEVLWELCPHALTVSAATLLRNNKALGVPSYKSVERVRRRIQAKCPELESERAIKKRKKEEEVVYKEYAKTS